MVNAPGGASGEQIGGRLDRLATAANMSNQILGKLLETLATILPFSGSVGTFTMPAAATTTINDANVQTNSRIFLQPTNASAGTLVGSNESPYASPSDYVVGTSFTVKTAAGTAAAGTEVFWYAIINVAV